MTYEQAACMAVAVQTMHNAVVGAGRLKKGESVLIQGASSGVGLMGMQIARHMGAARVMGTSTNKLRLGQLKEWGAHLSIHTSDPPLAQTGIAPTRRQRVPPTIVPVSGRATKAHM